MFELTRAQAASSMLPHCLESRVDMVAQCMLPRKQE